MTDKQIIIDASQCEWRTGIEHCGDYECMLNKCCDYNCDWYKRRKLEQKLKVKEQECEELKENLPNAITRLMGELDQLQRENEELKINNAQFIKDNEFLAKRNSKLKAENEELKEKVKKYGEINEQETKDYAELKAENDELKKVLTDSGLHNLTLMAEKRVLLQTLAEIKEIAYRLPIGVTRQQILQKINESDIK